MSNNKDIIFFGDSLTYGYGVQKEKSWVYLIGNILNLNYLNKGQNGDTTPSMLSRYYSSVLKYNPSKIFIMGGTNDLLCGRSISSIIENIEIMIKDAYAINSHVILGIPPRIIGIPINSMPERSLDMLKNSQVIKDKRNPKPIIKNGVIRLNNIAKNKETLEWQVI